MIQEGPHYELPATELARWLDQQGGDCWWTVDGDRLLTSRLSLPCPGDELAEALRMINKPLLVAEAAHANSDKGKAARGQIIPADMLDSLVQSVPVDTETSGTQNARWLYLCWKGSTDEWMLVEDVLTTESNRRDALELQREHR